MAEKQFSAIFSAMTCELWVIIAAGGSSRRYGERDNLLEMLGDLPVFLHSVKNFSAVCKAENMVVAVRPEALELYRKTAEKFLPELKVRFVPGGFDRSGSVRNALAALNCRSGVVAIHDAARPLASADLLLRVSRRAAVTGGAIAGVKVVDSLKLTDGKGNILNPVSRDDLYRAETPQVFDVVKLIDAYEKSGSESATDDAEIMRRAGYPVEVVDSEEFNLKLTANGDLEFLKIFYTAGK